MNKHTSNTGKTSIVGWMLIVTGVISEVLFALARLGGASVSPGVSAVAAMFIACGCKTLAVARAARTKAATGAPQPATRTVSAETNASVPMPPQMTALIHGELARRRRMILWIAGGFVALFLLGGAAINAGLSGPDGAFVFALMAALGLFSAAVIGGLWLALGERTLRRDAASGTFCRATGGVTIATVPGGHLLRVGEQVLLVNDRQAIKALRRLAVATVDYSRQAHIVFEVRDPYGDCVYRFGSQEASWRPPKDLAMLFAKYEPLGLWEAGELLLRPADALRFADELLEVRVAILGVDLWYPVERGICEDLGGMDLSSITCDEKSIERSVSEAKLFIAQHLPVHIEFVSFVLDRDETARAEEQ